MTDSDMRTTWRFVDVMKRFGSSVKTRCLVGGALIGVTYLSLELPLTLLSGSDRRDVTKS